MLSDLDNEITKPREKERARQRIRRCRSAAQHTSSKTRSSRDPPTRSVAVPAPPAVRRTPASTFRDGWIVLSFVIFFLLQRQDLRDRFIRLAGAGDLRRTTLAMDDAASRLSRYLLTQTAINTSFGVLVGTGLWFIGVPHPVSGAFSGCSCASSLYRPCHCRRISGGRSRLPSIRVGHDALGHGSVPRRRAHHRAGDRALALRPQHGAFRHGGAGRRGFLDIALGTGWTATVDATDDVPGCPRPACRAFTVSRGACSATSLHWRRRRAFTNACSPETPTKPRIKLKSSLRTNPCRPTTTKSRSGGLALAQLDVNRGALGSRAPGKDQRSGRMGHRRSFRPRRHIGRPP